MSLGSYWGGLRGTEVLAEKVTKWIMRKDCQPI